MDEERFWELVADSRRESGDDTELTSRLLFRRLRVLNAPEVVEFVRIWERIRTRLDTWPVTDAVCLLLGAVEEEDLDPILDWIISYGQTVAGRVVADPDSLVELAADAGNARAQWFGEFTTEAHIVVSGTWPLGYDPDEPDDRAGEHVDVADQDVARQRFPRLTAFRERHPELGRPELR
ncbi:DUF4240 domain-containing protein [Actinoplanes sp. HUAS TT8]|uniref:DUF4240 domain-containing protein n=1 Tax=Actinoplanes sp. HUAS TT8 TaxID=3447453 RepID=UPI003F52550B